MEHDKSLERKARKLIKEAMKQPISSNTENDGIEVNALCPTCYQIKRERVDKPLADRLGSEQAVVHQCAECRAIGREIDLDELKQVLSGERPPWPRIDENFTLSDLINLDLEDVKNEGMDEDNRNKK